MTQTPRDWQKDMEMCKDITSMSSKSEFVRMAEYWLQEAKRLEGLASGRGQEIIRKNREISELEARADAAEARKQRLKEAMNKIIIEFDNPHNETGIKAACKMRRIAEEILSTLYPDTPAPKEGD